jgi:hypothetical protein
LLNSGVMERLVSLAADPSVWAPTSAVAAVAGAGMTALAHFRNPRALVYSMPEVRRFMNCDETLTRGVELQINGIATKNPHILRFTIRARGRKDIPGRAFDSLCPIRFNFQVPILRRIGVWTVPSESPSPAIAIDGTELLLGPSLIHRRQTTTALLLVEGEPRLAPPVNTLCDVKIVRSRLMGRRLAGRSATHPVAGWAPRYS